MSNYTTQLKEWGATGQEYPNNYNYNEQEAPVDAWDNFIQNNVINDLKTHLIPLTNSRIESDSGLATNEPTSPEDSHLYHDYENEKLKIWDSTSSSWKSILTSGNSLDSSLDFAGLTASNVGSITGPSGSVIWDGTEINSDVVQSTGLDADTVDGTHASDLGSGASDSGGQILSTVTDFNFGNNLSVTDDGDGTVTVDSSKTIDTHTSISETGAQVLSSVDDIEFTEHLNVINGNDGTVTIDPTHNHDSRYIQSSNGTSITVTAGNQLTGGGTVSLGGSTSIDLNEGSGSGLDADLLDGSHATDIMVDIEQGGTTLVSDVSAINFVGDLSVSDDTDGTVTVDPSHNHDSRYYRPTGNDTFVVETRTSDPTSPVSGQVWMLE